ncbi:MAG: class I SAM-dependent methyltransferase [Trueperaceae bacterium]
MPREWDAKAYDELRLPHEAWGARALGRLTLEGSERVLDAGCGTGRDTVELLRRLPTGSVIAVDGSRRMLEELRTRVADHLERVEIVHADLEQPLPPALRADAVFSVAAFHWITDHDALFRNLAAVLRPGGRLVAECGGEGNVASIDAALEGLVSGGRVWNFPDPQTTEQRLARAGFTRVDVRLRRDPLRLERGSMLHGYLETVVLGTHLDRLLPSERQRFVRQVADRLPAPEIDYVRLEISAERLAS